MSTDIDKLVEQLLALRDSKAAVTKSPVLRSAKWADALGTLMTLDSLMFAFVIVVFTAHSRSDMEYGDLTFLNICAKLVERGEEKSCDYASFAVLYYGIYASILFMCAVLTSACGGVAANLFGDYFADSRRGDNSSVFYLWNAFMGVLILTTLILTISGLYFFFKMNQSSFNVLMPLFPNMTNGESGHWLGYVSENSLLFSMIKDSNYTLLVNPFTRDTSLMPPGTGFNVVHQNTGSMLESAGITISIVVPLVVATGVLAIIFVDRVRR